MRTLVIGLLLGCGVAVADERRAPSFDDLLRLPDEINTYGVMQALITGEPIKRPDWPIVAQYGVLDDFEHLKRLELQCSPRSTDSSVECSGSEKRARPAKVAACYDGPGKGEKAGGFVHWIDGDWSCSIQFHQRFFVETARADEMQLTVKWAASAILAMRKVKTLTGADAQRHHDTINLAHGW